MFLVIQLKVHVILLSKVEVLTLISKVKIQKVKFLLACMHQQAIQDMVTLRKRQWMDIIF